MKARASGQIIPRGDRKYTVRVFIGLDGTGKRKYINQTVKGNKKDAERVRTTLLRSKDTGTLNLETTRYNVQEYLEHWLTTAAEPRLSERSYQEYRSLLKRHIYPLLGKRRLSKLTPVEIQSAYTDMLSKGLSARTVRYTHTVFSNAIKQAVKWRMLSENPAQYVDLPKQQKNEMVALSQEDVTRFLAAAKADPYYPLFALLLGTGMRPGEAIALKWTDLDAGENKLTVQRTWAKTKSGYAFKPPKTGKSNRRIDLPESLTSLLLEHRETLPAGSLLMFPNSVGKPLSERNFGSRHFKPLLKATGLAESIRLYDFRHTHATLLLKAGVHPKIVSERLGHSTITLTMDTYSHVLPGMQRETAQKLEAMLFNPKNETHATHVIN